MASFSGSGHEAEGLAEHVAWVQALARRLARDAHDADDLAQDAWLAALAMSPRVEVRSLRGYLGGVLRNLNRMTRRAERRRVEHEQRTWVPEGEAAEAAGAEAALERAELARALVDCVLALEEPFRSAVLLRYGEGLSAPEAARRLGVPLKTLESRALRGRERLREAWTRRHGGSEESWRASLGVLGAPLVGAPLSGPPLVGAPRGAPMSPRAASNSSSTAASPSAASASSTAPLAVLAHLGALAMQVKLVALSLAAAGCAGALWLWIDRHSEAASPDSRTAAAPSAPAELSDAGALSDEPAATQLSRQPATASAARAEAASAPHAPASAEAPPRVLRGRVFDVDARALPGVAVVYHDGWQTERSSPLSDDPPRARATSVSDGRFELAVPGHTGTVRVDDPELMTLVAALVRSAAPADLALVAARHRPLAGRVVDDGGQPLAGARVALELPPGFLARFDAVLDAAEVAALDATTSADGSFALPRAALVPGARLAASLAGYAGATIDAPSGPAEDLLLVLARESGAGTLVGRVVDALGAPAPLAWVTLGAKCALTDASGAFALARAGAEDEDELVAVRRGALPAHLAAARDPASGKPLWPEWIELRLGGPPLALAGVIVDEEGNPRTATSVWVEDSTAFGLLGEDGIGARLEFLLGAGVDAQGDVDPAAWHSVATDASGRFELTGLLERDYKLRLLDSERMETLVAGPYRAGQDDRKIEFPRLAEREMRGRVVSRSGKPLAGVLVSLQSAAYGGIYTPSGSTHSDAEGRFSFATTGNTELMLTISGDGVLPDFRPLERSRLGQEYEIVASVLCHAKVELADASRADGFRILDAAGEPLDMCEIGATGYTRIRRYTLVGGRSRTLGVPEDGATLVLERGDEVVQRIPIRLTPGMVNLLAP